MLSLAAIVVVAGSWATPAGGETFPVRFVAGEDRSPAAAESLPEAWLVLQEEGEEGAARSEALVFPLAARLDLPARVWQWTLLGEEWIATGKEPLRTASHEKEPLLVRFEPQQGYPLRLMPSEVWLQVEEVGIVSSRL